jgi:predicted transcriptional regulator of viral defense system
MAPKDRASTLLDFILEHPVFRLEELQAEYRRLKRPPENALELVEYHIKAGRLRSIRRGVYAHPRFVDPWLVATKLADPVRISHEGALSFHGLIGVGNQVTYMTTARAAVVRFNDVIYRPLRVSLFRLSQGKSDFHERLGQQLNVTTLETTLVDCLDNLERSCPPLELMEIFQQSSRRADPSLMIKHALNLESPIVAARLGFFLMCARFFVPGPEMLKLENARPTSPTHFQRGLAAEDDGYVPLWKLLVPNELFAFWPRN